MFLSTAYQQPFCKKTTGEAALPPPQGDFLTIKKFTNYHSQGMSKAQAGGMPQSEVSGKSTVTAECEARAARRLSRRRREIFWRSGQSFVKQLRFFPIFCNTAFELPEFVMYCK